MNIQFDNGTVREAPVPASPASAASAQVFEGEPGKLKKCLRGNTVTYTDQNCPPGTKAAAVTGGNVTVVPSEKPKPAARDAAANNSRNTLRDALDLSGNDNIRDKMMERAIGK